MDAANGLVAVQRREVHGRACSFERGTEDLAPRRFLVPRQLDAQPVAPSRRVTRVPGRPDCRHPQRLLHAGERTRGASGARCNRGSVACLVVDETASGPPQPRTRARALGIEIGALPPGPTNSIVDVANVPRRPLDGLVRRARTTRGSRRRAHRGDGHRAVHAGRAVRRAGAVGRGSAQRGGRAHGVPAGPGMGGARHADPAHPHDGRRAGLRRRGRPDAGREPRRRGLGRRHPDGRGVRRLVVERRSGRAGRSGRRHARR